MAGPLVRLKGLLLTWLMTTQICNFSGQANKEGRLFVWWDWLTLHVNLADAQDLERNHLEIKSFPIAKLSLKGPKGPRCWFSHTESMRKLFQSFG